jgi:hypothetical protein
MTTEQINIGDPCTVFVGSDAYGATVIAKTSKTVTAQFDKATRIDSNGMSDVQEYSYERNPKGQQIRFRLTKEGRWTNMPYRLGLGYRRSYYDFSF